MNARRPWRCDHSGYRKRVTGSRAQADRLRQCPAVLVSAVSERPIRTVQITRSRTLNSVIDMSGGIDFESCIVGKGSQRDDLCKDLAPLMVNAR